MSAMSYIHASKGSAMSGVREDKVAELSALVDSGQYKVDAAKIADQMLGRALADRLK